MVTHEHLERANEECSDEHDDHGRAWGFCRLQANCDSTEMKRLRTLHRREMSACRLRKVPIAVQLHGGRETVYFKPYGEYSPAQEEAQETMARCSDARDRADLTGCMESRGWRAVGTERRSEWLLD